MAAESRFKAIDAASFFHDNENTNTLKKTASHINLLKRFLNARHNEEREIHEIPAEELNRFLVEFVINVRKADGKGEYEPSYLRGMISSFDRELKKHKYGVYIITSQEFYETRNALRLKQRDLKSKGKGDKPLRADPLTDQDINKLYETDQLGIKTPTSLINTLWYLNTLHFGIRGGSEEHRQICWGDIQLKHDHVNDQDYLEYHERTTKTRTGDDLTNTRVCPPRMYTVPDNRDRCPVATYMFYESKRPEGYCGQNDPFYIAVVTNDKTPTVNDRWFLKSPIGKNKIEQIMKCMAKNANLPDNKRFTNTSVRKTLVQKMTDSNVPDTLQVYVTGHKNVGSLNNYRSLNDNHNNQISKILSSTDSSTRSMTYPPSTSSVDPMNQVDVFTRREQGRSPSRPREMQLDHPNMNSVSQNKNKTQSIVEGMFAGSMMKNCTFNINFNNFTQPNPKRRRIIVSSDSDSD